MALFPGDLIQAAAKIRELYPRAAYDHRPLLTRHEPDYEWKQEENFRVGYACLKWAVAKVLEPRSIREFGVGGGVAALAMMDAAPEASYVGIDNGQLGRERGFDFSSDVLAKLAGRNAFIERIDSRMLSSVPRADLIHVDGNHLFDWAYHDMRLALASGTRWILCDDCRDNQVCAALFRAFYEFRQGPTEWAYFEDSWTGSILFCQDIVR